MDTSKHKGPILAVIPKVIGTMNWLNKLDDVLENVRSSSRHGTDAGTSDPLGNPNEDGDNNSSSSSSEEEAPQRRLAKPSTPGVPGMPGRVRRQRPTPTSTPTTTKMDGQRYPGSLKRTTMPQPGKPVAKRRLPHRQRDEESSSSPSSLHNESGEQADAPIVPALRNESLPSKPLRPTAVSSAVSAPSQQHTAKPTTAVIQTKPPPAVESVVDTVLQFAVDAAVRDHLGERSPASAEKERPVDAESKKEQASVVAATEEITETGVRQDSVSEPVEQSVIVEKKPTVEATDSAVVVIPSKEGKESPVPSGNDAQKEPEKESEREQIQEGAIVVEHLVDQKETRIAPNTESRDTPTEKEPPASPLLLQQTMTNGATQINTSELSPILGDKSGEPACTEMNTDKDPEPAAVMQHLDTPVMENTAIVEEPTLPPMPVLTKHKETTAASVFRNVGSTTGSDAARVTKTNDTEEDITPEKPPAADGTLDHVSSRDEFDAASVKSSWTEEGQAFDQKTMNCHGTVHVRVLRAQRLPCSVGSAVEAVISLKPWKGKVRTTKTIAFHGPTDDNGVCVRWEEGARVSMTHAYSSEESPVPSILIDLRFSPLGMFGFSMGSLSLSCRALLLNPSEPQRAWFNMETSESQEDPRIEVEAIFEPTHVVQAVNDTKAIAAPVDYVEVVERSTSFATATSNFDDGSVARPRLASDFPSEDGSLKTPRSVSKASQKAALHRLRLQTFRTPARCCVCKRSIMSGLWVQKAFRCEECNIDCCGDCRLQVDIKLACGSELASKAVSDAVQNNLTMDKVLRVLAPVRRSAGVHHRTAERATRIGFEGGSNQSQTLGIGTLNLGFVRSYVLGKSLPPESDPSDALSSEQTSFRQGDYYMRVTRVGSDDTARTHTIQNTGKPIFEAEEFALNIPHYGSEFRIELVDAATDKTLGTELLTTQSILHKQRDYLIETKGIVGYYRNILRYNSRRLLQVGLRFDMDKTTGSQYFSAPKATHQTRKTQKGDIVGYADILVGIEEDFNHLYGQSPYQCPPRPPDELDMNLFQVHLARLSDVIDDAKAVISTYMYAISWRNPLVTAVSFVVFLQCCSRFDPVYFGSLPAFLALVLMIYLALQRFFKRKKDHFTKKETARRRKAENVEVDYSLFRPLGCVGISVTRGRNIRSADMGLPGNCGCQVIWDPTRLMSASEREQRERFDEAAGVTHDISTTEYVYSAKPVWEVTKESPSAKRLKTLLSFEGKKPSHESEVIFPVLQPFKPLTNDQYALVPWSASKAALVVELRFNDVLNVLPGSEYVLGEVCIPFAELFARGQISSWFHIGSAGSTSFTPADADDGKPQVFLTARWSPPKTTTDQSSDTEREISIFVQEEMIRSAILSRQQRISFVGSSIGALNTVRGLGSNLLMVQNTLGSLLDFIEGARNAVNFTDPLKSTVILITIAVLYLFFCIVPIRVIIFLGGTLQYVATFVSRYRGHGEQHHEDAGPSPVMTWIMNAFRGIPTDEDLRKAYFWESRRSASREAEKYSKEKRKKRLRTLWQAQWYSSVELVSPDDEGRVSRESAFAVIQGHRFLWWTSTRDFDNGQAPVGRLFLAGHAGLTGPTPLELREIHPEEVERVVSLFGRGTNKQERVTMLAPSMDQKKELEQAVETALSNKAD